MRSTYFENDEILLIRVFDKPIALDVAGGDSGAEYKVSC